MRERVNNTSVRDDVSIESLGRKQRKSNNNAPYSCRPYRSVGFFDYSVGIRYVDDGDLCNNNVTHFVFISVYEMVYGFVCRSINNTKLQITLNRNASRTKSDTVFTVFLNFPLIRTRKSKTDFSGFEMFFRYHILNGKIRITP
jgi:hypothetical protein